ncbi:RNA-guided endonuclease InsQ/TnpB family protein, partial [Kitasatospora sp. NPDC092039]|uniref:RNA-guided endonuclease InsQ/TnpB family protein n=1 Tax=Kitasatospora sp. NPDC092039 TaxID=3364086 RepID=UPI003819CF07
MLFGRRYRLEVTNGQAELCGTFGDICRAVWNTALEQRREYRRRDAWMNYVPQAAELAEAKREFPWLAAAPSHILQQTLRDLERACRERGTFGVRWRSRKRWSPSFRFPDAKQIAVERIGRKWGRVRLPKLGWVRFRWSRPLGGCVRSATVTRRGRHWFISFQIEDGQPAPMGHPLPGRAIGIDRGVKVAVTTSDGEFYDRPFVTPGEAARMRRLQQKLARQRKGSNRRRETVAAIRALTTRARNRRADFCAWTANTIANRNALVALEDLRIKSMTASASGTVEEPGRNVRQKAGLNRSILDKGWKLFELALRNKGRTTGTLVVLVNPAYTSQQCNVCGHLDRKSRKSQADFRCAACGHAEHADVNAAKNILSAAGHAVPGRGDLGVARSVKRQPPVGGGAGGGGGPGGPPGGAGGGGGGRGGGGRRRRGGVCGGAVV